MGDRTRTRWGKFRPYLLWFAVPFGIISTLTFTTPGFSPNGKLIYAYITLVSDDDGLLGDQYSLLGA